MFEGYEIGSIIQDGFLFAHVLFDGTNIDCALKEIDEYLIKNRFNFNNNYKFYRATITKEDSETYSLKVEYEKKR